MNFLSKLFKRSVTICMAVLIALGAGIFFTTQMSVSLLPNIALPYLGVSIVYPGASATAVEQDVATPLEAQLRKVSNVNKISVNSIENAAIAVIEYQYGVNLDEKKKDLLERLDSIALPDSCFDPQIVTVDFNGTAVATVALYNNSNDLFTLVDDAANLQEQFSAIEGVGSVETIGLPQNAVKITPINGLEMTTLLLVQSLGLDALDIPIGQIIEQGGTVLVRNLSAASSLEQLRSKPIGITLGNSTWSALTTAKETLEWYERSTTVDLDEMKENIDGIREFLDELESLSNDELDKLSDNLTTISSLVNYVRTNSSSSMRLTWDTAIKPMTTNEEFLSNTDDEMEDLSVDTGIPSSLLVWVRDNSRAEEGETSNIETYWNKMVAFRKGYEEADKDENNNDRGIYIDESNNLLIENGDYCSLLYDIGIVQNTNIDGEDYYTQEELTDAITLARAINTVALASAVDSLKQHNDGEVDDEGNLIEPTNEQYAAIFANTDYSESLPMTASTIEIIRSEHFDENWLATYQYKQARQHEATQEEIDQMELEEGQTPPQFVAHSLTSRELFDLYCQLIIDTQLPITLTADLTEFLWTTDFTQLRYVNDNQSTLNTTIGAIALVQSTIEYDSGAFQNDNSALILQVFTTSGANQTSVCNQIKQKLANFSSENIVILLDDQSEFITDSIGNVVSSMAIGGLLAVLIILLFIKKIRTAAIIAITMPLSVLCTLMCLYFMDISLNMVSLGGLAVGIGMLVDNSIVVIESISLYRDRGLSPHQSAVQGTRAVISPLVASTLTSICVFFPILFTQGLTKEIFSDLSWSVIYSLSFSLVVAILVIPTLYTLVFPQKRLLSGAPLVQGSWKSENATPCLDNTNKSTTDTAFTANTADTAHTADTQTDGSLVNENDDRQISTAQGRNSFGKGRGKRGRGEQGDDTDFMTRGVTELLDRLLPAFLGKKWLVLFIALVLFASSVIMVFSIGMEFLPPADKGKIEVNISFTPTQDIDECINLTLQARDEIEQNIENIEYLSTKCAKSGLIAVALTGTVTVQLDKSVGVDTTVVVEQIRELLADNGLEGVSVAEIDGVVAVLTSGMSGLSIGISGNNPDLLFEASEEISASLAQLDYVRHIEGDMQQPSTEYDLRIDQNKCLDYGIDYSVLVQTLYVGISGMSPSDISIDGDTMQIEVVFADETLSNYYGGLEKFVVGFDGEGEAILLEDIATIEVSLQPTQINRENGRYFLTLSVETYGIDTGTASSGILKVVNQVISQEKYANCTASESGVNYYLSDAFRGLVIALVVSFFLLFAVMACQFESLVKPFIVIFAIPFSFTGAFLSLVLTGNPLTVVSFVGIIMLMGVVVNNAILMIERIGEFTSQGMDAYHAIIEGSKSRVRPILMTTLTTVFALLPLAFGLGSGADLMQTLGIVVIGGLTLGTMVTLVLIPVIYAWIKRVKKPTQAPADTYTTDITTDKPQ